VQVSVPLQDPSPQDAGVGGYTTRGPPPPQLDALQSVVTVQFEQSKLTVPNSLAVAVAVPLNWPLQLILTPSKFIQPVFSPQAYPDKIPWPLFVTPLKVGAKSIQP
jgi:hypothetical protein